MLYTEIFDCHVHSTFSSDGESTLQEMCEAAIRVGVSGLVFTDHIDTEKQEILNTPAARKDYVATIDQIRQHYGNSLTVLCGYELSAPHKNRQLCLELGGREFDYSMISVHHGAPNIPLSSEREYVASYLQEVEAAIQSGSFNVLGHIDLLRRFYGRFAYNAAQLENIYSIMRQQGMALEVNTHSLKKLSAITKNDLEYVELWKACGGKNIVLGSDAHVCRKIGGRFCDILPLLPTGIEIGHYSNKTFIADYIV